MFQAMIYMSSESLFYETFNNKQNVFGMVKYQSRVIKNWLQPT